MAEMNATVLCNRSGVHVEVVREERSYLYVVRQCLCPVVDHDADPTSNPFA